MLYIHISQQLHAQCVYCILQKNMHGVLKNIVVYVTVSTGVFFCTVCIHSEHYVNVVCVARCTFCVY
jgi:hypothetical protein